MNTLGHRFKITTFGESHGKSIGVVIDGFPAGIHIDVSKIEKEMARRKPGQSKITTQRRENDFPKIVSGIFNDISTGMPIAMIIDNEDQRSADYEHVSFAFRPSHADYTYYSKYGIHDYKGGGRSSARETANWVAAGALAKQLLESKNIYCQAYVSQVGAIQVERSYHQLDLSTIEDTIVRCPDKEKANEMINYIDQVRKNRDTVGGIITGVIKGLPVGIGEPIFAKLHAQLAHAMMSINAAKGFEYGSGFKGVSMLGSEHNDLFYTANGNVKTKTNNAGGILGGISNGEDIYFRIAFKPVATIMKDQKTIDKDGNETIVTGKGRHDPCVVPRAVPIVEALSAIVITDLLLYADGNFFQSK